MNDAVGSATAKPETASDAQVMAEAGLAQDEINRLEWNNPMN